MTTSSATRKRPHACALLAALALVAAAPQAHAEPPPKTAAKTDAWGWQRYVEASMGYNAPLGWGVAVGASKGFVELELGIGYSLVHGPKASMLGRLRYKALALGAGLSIADVYSDRSVVSFLLEDDEYSSDEWSGALFVNAELSIFTPGWTYRAFVGMGRFLTAQHCRHRSRDSIGSESTGECWDTDDEFGATYGYGGLARRW